MKHLQSAALAAIVSAVVAFGSLSIRAQHDLIVHGHAVSDEDVKSRQAVTIDAVRFTADDDVPGESTADSFWIEWTKSVLRTVLDAVRRVLDGHEFLTAAEDGTLAWLSMSGCLGT